MYQRSPTPPRNGTSARLAAATVGTSSSPRTTRPTDRPRQAPTTRPRPITTRNSANDRPMVISTSPRLPRRAAVPTASTATARVSRPRTDPGCRLQPPGGGTPHVAGDGRGPAGGGGAHPVEAAPPPHAAGDGAPHPAGGGSPHAAGGPPAGPAWPAPTGPVGLPGGGPPAAS